MKKRILPFKLSLLILSFILLHNVSIPTVSAASLPTIGVTAVIEAPSITPPDYTENECPVCAKDEYWGGDKGCCKMESKAGEQIADVKIICSQPKIIVCKENFFCDFGKDCVEIKKVGAFAPVNLCDKLAVDAEKVKCRSCMADNGHLWSAFGCLSADLPTLISKNIMVIVMSLAGGSSFLIFLYGAFIILTSSGDVERIKSGKRHLFHALMGILLIIFSVFILRIITIDILKIPGFGR